MITDQLLSPSPSKSIEVATDNSPQEGELHTVLNQVASHEFSIDELREIAYHFGVPHLAQITERETLVESIRRRI